MPTMFGYHIPQVNAAGQRIARAIAIAAQALWPRSVSLSVSAIQLRR